MKPDLYNLIDGLDTLRNNIWKVLVKKKVDVRDMSPEEKKKYYEHKFIVDGNIRRLK